MQRLNIKMLLASLVMLFSTSVLADEDIKQISNAIQLYFDGTSQGQPELVKQAFLPSLELQYVGKNGEFKRWKGTDYIGGIKQGRKNGRIGKIISIDKTGNAAMAKATVTSGNTLFTDYFLLLKVEGNWRITNKIFTREKKS